MTQPFDELTKKLMDAQIVTKAEMTQAIHDNNADFKQEMSLFKDRIHSYLVEQQKVADLKYEYYKKEVRIQTRWLIGIGITTMIGIAAILIKLHS